MKLTFSFDEVSTSSDRNVIYSKKNGLIRPKIVQPMYRTAPEDVSDNV